MAGKEVAVVPTLDDARSYISTVKKAFRRKPRKYKDFMKLMDDLHSRRLDRASILARVEELFKDHPNLLAGFNDFLPAEPEQPTQLPPIMEEDEEAEEDLLDNVERKREEAENLLNKIKERFQTCDTHVPDSYVKVMDDFKERKKSEKEVREEVIDLLYHHEDLVEEFLRLLQ